MALALGVVGFSTLQLGIVGEGEASTMALAVLVLRPDRDRKDHRRQRL